jgi:hypothetical protein
VRIEKLAANCRIHTFGYSQTIISTPPPPKMILLLLILPDTQELSKCQGYGAE